MSGGQEDAGGSSKTATGIGVGDSGCGGGGNNDEACSDPGDFAGRGVDSSGGSSNILLVGDGVGSGQQTAGSGGDREELIKLTEEVSNLLRSYLNNLQSNECGSEELIDQGELIVYALCYV